MSEAVAVPNIPNEAWRLPVTGIVGMICLIIAEAAIFIIFVVAYVFYIGKSLSGPYAEGCAHAADLHIHLPAIQQPYGSRRSLCASAEQTQPMLALVGGYGAAGWHISRGNRARVV